MKPIIALSSCWCSPRHQDGHAMLREMADLGFEYAELSHGIRITLVPGILKAVEEGVIQIASCHNFCPLPTGVVHAAPNLYLPSAADPRERDQWLRQSKRTVDFAAELGARKVVLHLGSVEFFWFNPSPRLERYVVTHAGKDLTADAKYQRLREKALARMRSCQAEFQTRMEASLRELATHAAAAGIQLGCENRERFDELPLDADFAGFLARLGPPCGYWHDTGHAQIKQGMGLLDHQRHLEQNAASLIGFHLHDVRADGRDHQPIGAGRVDFEMVSGFWRPEHVLVLEFSPRLTPDDVRSSRARVEALVARRFP